MAAFSSSKALSRFAVLGPVAFACVAALQGACSSSGSPVDSSFGGSRGGSSASGGTSGTAGSSGTEDGGGILGPVTQTPSCTAAAKLVYVIDDQGMMHSFAPTTKTFATVGKLDCPSTEVANSMAVARDGTAYINYTDGAIYKASVNDARCTTTPFKPRSLGFGNQFGMGFSTNVADGTDETLFISDLGSGRGLASVDLTTMQAKAIGDFDTSLALFPAELTGTGDARLFGFFVTSPDPTLALIDKATAKTSNAKKLTGVPSPTHFAFSFWGGDFYFYTANVGTNPNDTTTVTKLTTSDGSITPFLSQIGFRIVGAGVSTCAPTTAPR